MNLLQKLKMRIGRDGIGSALRYYFSKHYFRRKKRKFVETLLGICERWYFRSRPQKTKETALHIFVPIWGDHIDMFFSYGLPSLIQYGNIPRVLEEYDVILKIYTKPQDAAKVAQNVRIHKISSLTHIHPSIGEGDKITVLNNALLDHITACLKNNAYMLVCTADYVFGNHSLYNGIKSIEGKGVCFAAAHPRVSYEDIKAAGVNKITLENDELVDFAFKYPHPQFLNAEDSKDWNTSWGGISWRKINNRLYEVVHGTTSVWIASLRQSDYDFFKESESFNAWDKTWMAELIRQRRVKYCGSSDIFFLVELSTNKIYAKPQHNLKYNDFVTNRHVERIHNQVANLFVISWRGRKMKIAICRNF